MEFLGILGNSWESWGMTEEDSSSNYKSREDRNPKIPLSPKTSSRSSSSPTATQGALDRRNTANRSVSGNRRSRGWNPAEKSSKNISEEVPQGCILSPSLHPVRHFRDSRREDSGPWTFEIFVEIRVLSVSGGGGHGGRCQAEFPRLGR